MTTRSRPVCLAVSIGEPGGIGAELLLRLYRERAQNDVPPFFIVGDPHFVAGRARSLGWNQPVRAVTAEEGANYFRESLPVLPITGKMGNRPGELAPADGPAVVEAIETAVLAVARGHASAVVTAPIHKANLYATGFKFPGHTEFLGELGQRFWQGAANEPVMMLAGPELRTVPVTVHIALSEVPRQLTTERIIAVGEITARDLRRRFGIAFPRLALAGVNPHAGENGAMGTEDEAIIAPAVAALKARGIDATGPHPADTLFHAGARQTYDAVLAMYHDQALIPVKTIAFDETVNVTLGLPFIRTSPDHGTALNIAGKGIARPQSMLAALKMAAEMAGVHG